MFFVVRSNDSFNFPLGLIKYVVIVVIIVIVIYFTSSGSQVAMDYEEQGLLHEMFQPVYFTSSGSQVAMDYEEQGLLHEIFQRQARERPDDVAVVSVMEGRTMTFAELDQWSDLLAAALQQRGAAPDRCVAICLDKTVDFVIAYLAILKAGGCACFDLF